MYFSPAFILAALPFVAALPTPVKVPKSLSIPLSRRDTVRRADGSVDRQALSASVRSSVAFVPLDSPANRSNFQSSKVYRGISAYEVNTGGAHSLATLISAPRALLGKRQAGAGAAADALTDANQVLWYGTIEVGTPPKQYTVDFDTGSSDLFLPGSTCGTTCANHTLYNPASSSTSSDLQKSFSLAYGDGSTVNGEQFSDVVSISGLTVTNQTLGSATTYSTGFESPNFPADGLLGMAFPSISVYGANPLFQNLVAANAVSQPVFGFKLAPQGAELFIGGTDTQLFSGDFTYVNVTQQGYWQVELGALSINGVNVIPTQQVSSIIDTGTTLIVGDTQTVAKAYQGISGALDNGDGTYTIPCDATPNVSLTFGNESFAVSPASFVLGSGTGATSCIGGLSYNDAIAGQFWIVGDVFLQNVYTEFDAGNSRVGFATLTANSTTSTPPSSISPSAVPSSTSVSWLVPAPSSTAAPVPTASTVAAPAKVPFSIVVDGIEYDVVFQ